MSQKFRNILITGATGQLGKHIVSSKAFPNVLIPSRKILDIAKPASIKKYFKRHSFDAIIHTAAVARMLECQNKPDTALQTNLIGTASLVEETLRKDKKRKVPIRFIYISTDGVYSGTRGKYKETDPTVPYNNYGWTKLGGECAVQLLSNFCIIRTRFFDPSDIPFRKYPSDAYNSNVAVDELVNAIYRLLYSDFTGVINVGKKRESDYVRYKKFKPSIQPCLLKDIQKKVSVTLSQEASLNCSLWDKMFGQSPHVS